MRQIYPVQGPDLPVVATAGAGPLPPAVAELARLYGNEAHPGPAPVLRANMVASTDGAASADGRSGGLSGRADRMVFTVLRSLADLVLVGAGTARAERYRPAQAAGLWPELRPQGSPVPAIALVSARLAVDPDTPLLTAAAPGAQTIVITARSAPADRKAAIARHARIICAGEEQVDLAAAMAELGSLGYRGILCEGGPTLLGALDQAGLLDELCLTISPRLVAGTAGRIVRSAPGDAGAAATAAAKLTLAHLLADDSFLFCRYLREH